MKKEFLDSPSKFLFYYYKYIYFEYLILVYSL